MSTEISKNNIQLFDEIRELIAQSKQKVAYTVNAEISMLYWNVGKRINTEILGNKRAEYGKQILHTLSIELTKIYGKGWSEQQLRHCLRVAETFQDSQKLYTVCIKLSWSHIRQIMYVDDSLKRDFYIQMCIHEKWSFRTLRERMQSMLYERTVISKKPEETIKQDLKLLKNEQIISPDLVFKDPYFLDFLNLSDSFSEKDLEDAILIELQRFIIEMGTDFAFLARQKSIIIDSRNYRIDLLFYHRRLKSLVVIDLKMGEFEAGDKGQMELYLNYMKKHETIEGENAPIGLILCAGKNSEHIELMDLERSNIKVAEYLTILPPKKMLKEKLHRAIEIAHLKIKKDKP